MESTLDKLKANLAERGRAFPRNHGTAVIVVVAGLIEAATIGGIPHLIFFAVLTAACHWAVDRYGEANRRLLAARAILGTMATCNAAALALSSGSLWIMVSAFGAIYCIGCYRDLRADPQPDREPQIQLSGAPPSGRPRLIAEGEDEAPADPTQPAAPPSADSAAEAIPEIESDVSVEELEREPLDVVLAELDSFIGLQQVKEELRDLIATMEANKHLEAEGLPNKVPTLHMTFEGPPGTGKTEMGRLVARAFSAMGILDGCRFVSGGRQELVGGWKGHSAHRVRDAVNKADGGVLFIDEAYSLLQDEFDEFGREVVNALTLLAETKRSEFCLILAGYPEEIQQMLDKANPGLRSRFPTTIHFTPYSPTELMQILERFVANDGRTLAPDAREYAQGVVERLVERKLKNWANAREMRILHEQTLRAHSRRLYDNGRKPSKDALCRLERADVQEGLRRYLNSRAPELLAEFGLAPDTATPSGLIVP